MNTRKTQRKNKTKQVILWPSQDTYFTIPELVKSNTHMLTSSTPPSDITIRVRLKKAIDLKSNGGEEIVAVIGQRNCGKGRPQLVFAMRPVKQSVVDKAKSDGITIDMTKVMAVMEVSTSLPITNISPVTNIIAPSRMVNA